MLSRDMTDAHNAVRVRLGLPALRWSDELAAEAQRWANTLAARNELMHDGSDKHGQNLFDIFNGGANPWRVVSAWAAESRYYNARTNTCSRRCGHYTQMVWRDTKELGCAVARHGNREVWVCDYAPVGNVIGERPY